MSRIWSVTKMIQNGSPAHKELRFGSSPSVTLCANFENAKYQPKTVSLDRLGRKI